MKKEKVSYAVIIPFGLEKHARVAAKEAKRTLCKCVDVGKDVEYKLLKEE